MASAFRKAVEAHDADAMAAALDPDVTFRSPIVFQTYEGRDAVMHLLRAVVEVFDDFRYVDELHGENTTALVVPAHTLKGEARQLGAEPLAKIAELIETTARFCLEAHRFPDELVPQVVELRTLFNQTVELFEKATNPLVQRAAPTGFGRKVTNQGFGRI